MLSRSQAWQKANRRSSSKYFYLSRCAFAFWLIALFFAVIALFTSLLALCTRLGAYLTGFTTFLAFVFQALAASLMTYVNLSLVCLQSTPA